MRPIGDLDYDELSLVGAGEEDLAVPPAIPELRRRLLLTRLVLRWGERRGDEPLLPGQAAALAASLARLLDRVAARGRASTARAIWRRPIWPSIGRVVLRFLEILPQHWPPILAAEGALDPAERRNRLLRQQAASLARLAASPSGHRRRADRRHPGDDRAASAGRLAGPGRGDPARARPRPRCCRVVGDRRGRRLIRSI